MRIRTIKKTEHVSFDLIWTARKTEYTVGSENLKKKDLLKMNTEPVNTQAIRVQESLNIGRLRLRKA